MKLSLAPLSACLWPCKALSSSDPVEGMQSPLLHDSTDWRQLQDEVGKALQEIFAEGVVKREEVRACTCCVRAASCVCSVTLKPVLLRYSSPASS